MKKITLLVTLLSIFLFVVSCDDGNGDIYGDTGDSTDTGNSAASADDSADTANTVDTADTTDTGNSADDSDNANTSDSADADEIVDDSGDSANSAPDENVSDTGNYTDTDSESGYAAPYGKAIMGIALTYIITDERDIDEDTMIVKDPMATGQMGSGSIRPTAQGISTDIRFIKTTGESHYLIQQTPYNFGVGTIVEVNPIAMLTVPEKLFATGELALGFEESDKATLIIADVDFSTGIVNCWHAVGVGTISVTKAISTPGEDGRLSFNGQVDIFSPKNIPAYGGDITNYKIKACPVY